MDSTDATDAADAGNVSDPDRRSSGFKDRTKVADARRQVLENISPHERIDNLSLGQADSRVLAEPITASRAVPGYERAAMDGWAVRARDTFGAGDRSPKVLQVADETAESVPDTPVGPNEAVRVHTGSALPDGANAVVMIEQVTQVGTEIEVFDAVTERENVAPIGEDVAEAQSLYSPGHQLRPSDLGLLKSVGHDRVSVYERPTVGVIPTGEELVQSNPGPGEVVETNGLTVSHLANRWGGTATYRNVVTDDPAALRAAIQRDLTKDVVVTTGGSSVGSRDLVPEIVDALGSVLVHGVALKPGHPVAVGVVEDTPVIMLPGYPVAAIVNAVQFLRPILKYMGHLPRDPPPSTTARLSQKIPSEPGVRTFARVRTETATAADADTDTDTDTTPNSNDDNHDVISKTATPTRTSGSGVLSSVALADGWVVVPESREGLDAGETVSVEQWEWST
jgi:molybdopterin molybdochelatase